MDGLACDRMFVAVMEQGSFTAAAKRLGTSSGQASKLVARLEEQLGVQLLVRTTRALMPTDAGQLYFDRMRVMLEERAALEAMLQRETHGPIGRLRLSLPISFGSRVLTPILVDFAERNPGLTVEADFADRAVNLVEEGFDAAFRIAAPQDSGLIMRRLCDIRMITVAAPDYLQKRGEPQHPGALADHDCILDGNFRNPRAWLFRSAEPGREQSVTVAGRLQFANAEAVAMAALAGQGLAQGPSFVLGPLVREGRLIRVMRDWEVGPLPLAVVYPANRHVPGKLRALLEHLASRFRGTPEWDLGLL